MSARTNMFSGFGKSFWKGASGREVFKFSLYLIVPLLGSFVYANPPIMEKLIRYLNFVNYPESGPKIPIGDEMAKLIAKKN
eukprot:gene5496-11065_t